MPAAPVHPAAGSRLARAAEKGDAASQVILGLMYAKGFGVPQDLARAKELWERAARRGYADA